MVLEAALQEAKEAIGASDLTMDQRINLISILAGLEKDQVVLENSGNAEQARVAEARRKEEIAAREKEINRRYNGFINAISSLNLNSFSFYSADASPDEIAIGKETANLVAGLQDALKRNPGDTGVRDYVHGMLETSYDDTTKEFKDFGFQDNLGSIINNRDPGFLRLVGQVAAGTNKLPKSDRLGQFLAIADELQDHLHPAVTGAISHYKLATKIGSLLGYDVEQVVSSGAAEICHTLAPKLQMLKGVVVEASANVTSALGMQSASRPHPSGLDDRAAKSGLSKDRFPSLV